MPSPITTSGFQVTARPGIDYVDPRSMAPAYDKVIPSISQGLGTVGQFAQIMDEAKMSPLRRRLAQIQIQDAEARLALAPIEEQMAVARLQEAQQNAAVPHVLADTVELSGGERRLAPRNLDAGFGNIQFDESYTPRVRTTTGREIGAGGAVTPFSRTETLATAAQVEADAIKQNAAIKAQEALAAQRGREKAFESEAMIRGYQEALDAGDEETAAMYKKLLERKSMAPGILPTGTVYGRELEKTAARIGIPVERIAEIAENPLGASAISKLSQQQAIIKAGRSFIPPNLRLSASEQAVIDGVAATEAETPKGDQLARPKNKAEYDVLPSGTKYVGPDGKTRIKK